MRRFGDARVAAVFKACPPAVRARAMALREMLFDVAAGTTGVGRLTETLKWGQPSYLFTCEGKRAIHFDPADRMPARELRHCLALAFTHHSRKKKPKS